MKISVTACDKCHVRSEKKPVAEWSLRRGATRWSGELCDKCFQEILKTYQPSSMSRARHVINETKINDIPKLP